MTNETKEKAIRWLTEEVRSLRMAPKVNGCEPDNWAESLEVMETCLDLVRGCNQVANKSQFGCNPLTMEQLLDLGEKAESGEKVIVYCTPLNDWCKVFKYGIMFFGTEDYRSWREIEETYGRDWLAYAYPPAHIDMEAWGGCVCTTSDKSCCTCVSMNCHTCVRQSEYKRGRYCSACGRPLTEEASAELEKRLMG